MNRLPRMAIPLLACLPAGIAQPAYDLWPDRHSLPSFDQVVFLPIFLPPEPIFFVDLGGTTVMHMNKEWRALQFTRDKEFSLTVPSGKYLFGLIGDDWPPNTVDPRQELSATRLVEIEIDGNTIPVNQSFLQDFTTGKSTFLIYNILPRFLTPGAHTLKYRWRQVTLFYFIYPYEIVFGFPDPYGLGGRRVFLPETVGDAPLDGSMTLSYALTVE